MCTNIKYATNSFELMFCGISSPHSWRQPPQQTIAEVIRSFPEGMSRPWGLGTSIFRCADLQILCVRFFDARVFELGSYAVLCKRPFAIAFGGDSLIATIPPNLENKCMPPWSACGYVSNVFALACAAPPQGNRPARDIKHALSTSRTAVPTLWQKQGHPLKTKC